MTNKLHDYLLWRQVLILINQKEHLTKEGLRKIVAIKATMNLGLPDKLKEAFPDLIPVQRSLITGSDDSSRIPKISDSNEFFLYWLAGFTSAEGCFFVNISKSAGGLKERIRLRFVITQHYRDEGLMKSLTELFNCGDCRIRTGGLAVDFIVEKFTDLTDKIIPFFQKYCIIGIKLEDFQDFCRVAELMKEKKHLTPPEGIDQIRKIKAGMNKVGRSKTN